MLRYGQLQQDLHQTRWLWPLDLALSLKKTAQHFFMTNDLVVSSHFKSLSSQIFDHFWETSNIWLRHQKFHVKLLHFPFLSHMFCVEGSLAPKKFRHRSRTSTFKKKANVSWDFFPDGCLFWDFLRDFSQKSWFHLTGWPWWRSSLAIWARSRRTCGAEPSGFKDCPRRTATPCSAPESPVLF